MPNNAFTLSGLIPLGNSDINANDVATSAPQNMGKNRGGTLGFMIDQAGLHMYRYVQNRKTSGSFAQGSLVSRVGGNTGQTSAGSPVGNSATGRTFFTCSSLTTANIHVGGLAYMEVITSNAAPQGESSPIVAQALTSVTMDPKYPLSAAIPASGSTIQLIGTYNTEASASGDISTVVAGITVGSDGIDNNNFGWVQSWGFTPYAIYNAAIAAASSALKAGTANLVVAAGGAQAPNLIIGHNPTIITTASPTITGPVWLTLDFGLITSNSNTFSFA